LNKQKVHVTLSILGNVMIVSSFAHARVIA
jgi:hypothetical protein